MQCAVKSDVAYEIPCVIHVSYLFSSVVDLTPQFYDQQYIHKYNCRTKVAWWDRFRNLFILNLFLKINYTTRAN
jgi:hypothetical protein